MRGAVVVAARADLPGRLDAVHHRHADVHQHDVGRCSLLSRTASAPSAALRDDGDVRLRVEQRGEPGTHDLLVVGDERADHDAAPGRAA